MSDFYSSILQSISPILEKVFRANGMSFAKLIKDENGENMQASQRVEFRVLTKSEEKIYEILDKLQK